MTFSCIIPAYNEGPRIVDVLSTVLACDHLDEIIVIDDGSTDDTWERISSLNHTKLQKIQLPKNGGKTNAVLTGIRLSIGDHIVMIDSDLLYLTPEHIQMLIDPVKNKKSDITLSLRKNSLLLYRCIGTDFVSGERVVPRQIFTDESYYLSGPGFGLEVLMNAKIIQQGYTIKNIYLENVMTPRKREKIGYIRGTLADIRMIYEIITIMPLYRILYQMWYFSRFYQK